MTVAASGASATDLRRLLLTHNGSDFLLVAQTWRTLARRWRIPYEDHAGIIIVPQRTATFPWYRIAQEVDTLVRDERLNLWGHVFAYDIKWGWSTKL